MAREIKVDRQQIESVLNQLQKATGNLTTDFSASAGQNRLDVTDKLKNISQLTAEILSLYKDLLQEDIEMVKRAVDTVEETERNLSDSIRRDGGGRGDHRYVAM